MSDEIRKDRLEEFFRTHLEHFEEDPGEALFADIAANIPPKPSLWEKFRGWILPSLGLILLAALIFSLLQYRNVKDLSSQVNEQTQEIEGLKKQLESIEENTISANTDTDTNETEQQGIETQNNKAINSNSTAQFNYSNTEAAKTKTSSSTLEPKNSAIQETTKSIDNFSQNNLQFTSDENSEFVSASDERKDLEKTSTDVNTKEQSQEKQETALSAFLGPLSPIQQLELALLDSKLSEEEVKAFDAPIENYPHFYYMAYFEPMRMRELGVSGIAVDSSTLNGSVSNYGLLGGLQFSKHWSIQTGLGFRNINVGLENNIRSFDYTLRNAVTDDNGFVTSEFIVGTGMKDIVLKLTNELQNDGKDIEGGESFRIELNVPYALRYYHVPLWLRYHHDEGKYHLSVKLGVIYHALMGEKYGNITSEITGDHPSINRLKFNSIDINVPSTKNNFIELGAGIGIQYELTKNIRVGVDPTFYRSLNPVFERNTWGVGLHTNISYRFN